MRFGRWELSYDTHNWVLIRHYTGKSKKTGKPVPRTQETYHRDLRQVSNWILNWEAKYALDNSDGKEGAKACVDLKSLMEAVKERENHLAGILEELKKGGVL